MRFVAKHFPSPTTMLDIGCGEGANARELYHHRRHQVFSIDKNPNVDPPIEEAPGWHTCVDILDYHFKLKYYFEDPFGLIYDINTLCHVKLPPFEKIKSGLGSDGIFFSICPQFGSSSRVGVDKEYTRYLTLRGAQELGDGVFSSVKVGSATYRLPGDEMYASWLIECRP